MVRIEVVEGVVIEVDEEQWEVRGIPLGLNPASQPLSLQFDLSLVGRGEQTSKVDNVLTLGKVRR